MSIFGYNLSFGKYHMDQLIEQYKYPIGRFQPAEAYTPKSLVQWIGAINSVPFLLDYCIENLDEAQLNTAYRPGG